MDSNRAEINSAFPETKPNSRRNARLGYLLAVLCLVWVFYDVHPRQLWDQVDVIRWGWVVLALGIDILAYVCQGLRWKLLLRPLGRPSVLKTTEAIYSGLFVNEISPLRAGEALRMFLMARYLNVSVLSVLSTVTIERLFDGIWVALGIALVSLSVHLPRQLVRAGDIFDIALLIAIVVLLVLVLRRRDGSVAPPDVLRSKLGQGPKSSWEHFLTGLHQVSFSRHFFLSAAISLFVTLFHALSLWLLMQAYGLRFPMLVGIAVFIIVNLGTAIPNAPANIGSYQFFTVVALGLFGVEKTVATGFSVVAFLLLTLPLLLLGFVAITRSGMSLAGLRVKLAN